MLLTAGPVQVLYHQGFLRYFKIAGQEALRMIYFAVRDQDWETIVGTITNENLQITADSFSISYTYHISQAAIQMQWQVQISGKTDGTITFNIHGVAQSAFLKNRAGFCVLHPIAGVSGQPCRLEHPDGSFSYGTFPTYISPHQPFLQLQAMEWPLAGAGQARLEFSGDIFETEDQRNWSDASYKTYCTPLSQPKPAQIKAGDQIKQQIIFRLTEPITPTSVPELPVRQVTVHPQPKTFPAIGLQLNATGPEPSPEEAAFLRSSGLHHVRADIYLNHTNWPAKLKHAVEQSALLQIPLELALFFGEAATAEVNHFLAAVRPHYSALNKILVFAAASRFTTDALLQAVAPALRQAFPNVPLGGGSDTNFTELNRHSFTFAFVDFVAYSLNPQVHAFDNLSLIENTAAQADTVQSAQHLSNNLPVHVSPVTLKPRSPEATTSDPASRSAPADPRQATDFGAGWTLASLKYLTEAGASSITYFKTTGPAGICQHNQPFAVGHLLAYLLAFRPEQVLPTTYPEPLKISSLFVQNQTTACLLLTNHTATPESVILPENFLVQRHTIISATMGQSSFPNYLPDQQLTLAAYQLIALEGILE